MTTKAPIYLLLLCVVALAVVPLLWGLSTALKPKGEVVTYPPRWIPRPPTLRNFSVVLRETSMPRYFVNSLLIGLCSVVLTLGVGAHAGYALARFRFPGKHALAFGILATAMIPGISILVPLYALASKVKLYDGYSILVIVCTAWQVPTVMWMLKGFLETVPRELDESALIDGCTRWSAFYRVILPLARPGLAAAALLTFVFVWNDFLIAFTLTVSNSRRVVAVGLYQYISQYGIEWGELMAAVTLALLPVLGMFLALQRHFISGLTAGAMKG
jgi:ABC-type glycerol-3-phosphate transport system permease component